MATATSSRPHHGRLQQTTPQDASHPRGREMRPAEGGEDEVDGAMARVTVRQRRSKSPSPLRQRQVGGRALSPTCIYRTHVVRATLVGAGARRTPEDAADTRCMPFANMLFVCSTPPMAETTDSPGQITGRFKVFLNNPLGAVDEQKVPLGVNVISILDNDGSDRHFLEGVQADSPAEQLGFRGGDEILILQDRVIFDKSHESVIGTLETLCVDKEFTLFTRRPITTENHTAELTTQYEFFDTKATISLVEQDDKIVPQVVQYTRSAKNIGDIFFERPGPWRTLWMQVEDEVYLKVINGKFKITNGLTTSDPAYVVEMMVYHCYTVTSRNMPEPLSTPAVMLRHRPVVANGTSAKYLVIGRGDRPALEERYVGLPSGPQKLNEDDHDAIFFYHDMGSDTFALELFTRREFRRGPILMGTFVGARGGYPRLFLTEIQDESERRQNPYIRFTRLNLTATDHSFTSNNSSNTIDRITNSLNDFRLFAANPDVASEEIITPVRSHALQTSARARSENPHEVPLAAKDVGGFDLRPQALRVRSIPTVVVREASVQEVRD